MLTNKSSLIVATAAFLLSSSALSASDLNGKGSAKDAGVFDAPASVNWGGFYLGAQAGYAIITSTYEDSPYGESFESPILGAIAGFDIARGRFVFGPFAEYTYITADEADDVTDWAAGFRAGYVVAPRTLVYGSIAYAQLSEDDEEVNGLRAGIGTEFALGGNIFADLKANYTWYDLEEDNDQADAGDLRVLGGIKLKFNSGIPGIN